MAKSAGEVSCGSYNYTTTNATHDDPIYIYFVHRTVRMPARFNTETPPKSTRFCRHKVKCEVKVTDASFNIKQDIHIGSGTDVSIDYDISGNVAAAAWQSQVEQTDYCNTVDAFTKFPGTGEKIYYILTRVKLWNTGQDGGDTSKIYHTAFESIFDSTTLDGEGFELTERGTDRIYGADYPMSSHHIMKLIADTHEKMIYDSKPIFCVPLFGVVPAAPV